MADHGFEQLASSRLILRRLRHADLLALYGYRSDPEVARYQDWNDFSEEAGRRLITEQAERHPGVPGTWFQMGIELRESGQLIGDCGLHTLRDHPQQAEIGFTLAPAHQGKGYATEAIRCLLGYVFGTLGTHRVIAMTDARNAPAARILERVGMRREGHFLQNVWFKGAWGDEYLYAVLAREWSGPENCSKR